MSKRFISSNSIQNGDEGTDNFEVNYESGREGGLRRNSLLTTELSEASLNYTDYDVSASDKPSRLYELCVIASKFQM